MKAIPYLFSVWKILEKEKIKIE